MDIFKAIKKVLGEKDFIAEDLGYMTDSVRQLVKESGFPGMKVLEFAFDSRDTGCRNDYLPHNYSETVLHIQELTIIKQSPHGLIQFQKKNKT